MIKLENIQLRYKGEKKGFFSKPSRIEILKDIDIDFPEASVCCVLGESGCGKSALLRIMALEESGFEGKILINGKAVPSEMPYKEARKMIGYVMQDAHIRADQNLSIFEYFKKCLGSEQVSKSLVSAELARFGLDYIDPDRKFGTLSGGQAQTSLISAQIAKRPKLFLADQPLSAMDNILKGKIIKDLTGLALKEKSTVILVVNDLNVVRKYADKVLLLDEGKIIEFSELLL